MKKNHQNLKEKSVKDIATLFNNIYMIKTKKIKDALGQKVEINSNKHSKTSDRLNFRYDRSSDLQKLTNLGEKISKKTHEIIYQHQKKVCKIIQLHNQRIKKFSTLNLFFNTEAKLYFAYTSKNMTDNAIGKN